MDTVHAEDVRDLMWVGDDGRGPEREHEPRELVHHELHRLEMHVCVDEAGDDVLPGRVEGLSALVVAEPRDDAVHDRDVGLQPLPREDREHAPAADDEIGWLVTARYGNPALQIRHGPSVLRREIPGSEIAAPAPRPMLCAVL